MVLLSESWNNAQMNGNQTKALPADWWADTVACWRRLPNKIFFFALLAAWLLLFQFWGNSILGYVHTSSLFVWLDEAYNLSLIHISEPTRRTPISYAVFCLKKKKTTPY